MLTYTTLLIPSSLSEESLALLAHKLRNFKLHALLSDPNAFSQSYASESLLPTSAWEARVANSDFRIVVCVVDDRAERDGLSRGKAEGPGGCEAESGIMTVKRLIADEWVGTFTLVGPVARETWVCPLSGQPTPGLDGTETRWHLTSLFVLPEHRGCGLAAALTLAAIRAGSSASLARFQEPANQGPTRFRLIVHPMNKSVVGLYEKLGFVVGGAYTQREAMVAMGDTAGAARLPPGAEGEKYDTRSAIGMEYII